MAENEGKELVGKVTHYFNKLGVALIELSGDVKDGEELSFEGTTTNFTQKAESMEIERKNVEEAKAGQAIGMKVKDRVREGDLVYRA